MEDDSKLLLLAVLEQAVQDYLNFAPARLPALIGEQKSYKIARRDRAAWNYNSAKSSLFDPGYFIDWGNEVLDINDVFLLLDIDNHYFYSELRKREEEKSTEIAGDNSKKTQCIRGHAFSPENTQYSSTGARSCIACKKVYYQTRRIKQQKQKE